MVAKCSFNAAALSLLASICLSVLCHEIIALDYHPYKFAAQIEFIPQVIARTALQISPTHG